MKFRRTTSSTLANDLGKLAVYVRQLGKDSDSAALGAELAAWFNTKMDYLMMQDVFGTEGQSDPRGDHRS